MVRKVNQFTLGKVFDAQLTVVSYLSVHLVAALLLTGVALHRIDRLLQFSILDLELRRDQGSLRLTGFEPALQGSRRAFHRGGQRRRIAFSPSRNNRRAQKPIVTASSINLEVVVFAPEASCGCFKTVLTLGLGLRAARCRHNLLIRSNESRRRGLRVGVLKQC